jgi:hypothetical protein
LSYVGVVAFLGLLVLDIASNLGWLSLAQNILPQRILLVLSVIAYLSFIFVGLYTAIQRKLRSGKFLPSKKEYAEARARWRNPRPLWPRIMTALFFWLFAVIFTVWTLGNARHHPTVCNCLPWFDRFVCAGGLGLAATLLMWLAALIWVDQILRSSKGSSSHSG